MARIKKVEAPTLGKKSIVGSEENAVGPGEDFRSNRLLFAALISLVLKLPTE